MRKEKWAAIYMPMRSPEKPDPSRYNFATKEEAEQHVLDNMCDTCKEERARKLAGLSDPNDDSQKWDSAWPACFMEWVVVTMRAHKESTTFDELMTAAGFKTIYSREVGKEYDSDSSN